MIPPRRLERKTLLAQGRLQAGHCPGGWNQFPGADLSLSPWPGVTQRCIEMGTRTRYESKFCGDRSSIMRGHRLLWNRCGCGSISLVSLQTSWSRDKSTSTLSDFSATGLLKIIKLTPSHLRTNSSGVYDPQIFSAIFEKQILSLHLKNGIFFGYPILEFVTLKVQPLRPPSAHGRWGSVFFFEMITIKYIYYIYMNKTP